MAPVDSILNLVDRQGANELRLGSDKEPQMFADGTPKRLVIPKTSTQTLRELLGELLTAEREQELVREGRVEFLYEPAALGPFRVALTGRPNGDFDAMFLKGRGRVVPAPRASEPRALETTPAVAQPTLPTRGPQAPARPPRPRPSGAARR